MRIVGHIDDIIGQINAALREFKKQETDEEYKNWIEGILQSAIAVLQVAR